MTETNTSGSTQTTDTNVTVLDVVKVPHLDISEITEVTLKGNGIYDVLLQTMRLHLKEQWDAGRITGHEYASVYTELVGQTLNAAIQIADNKAKLAYVIKGLESDNALKLAQLDLAKQQLLKQPYEIEQLQAQTAAIKEDTLSKLPAEIANIRKQGELIDAQVKSANYDVEYKSPKELELMTAQVDNARKEVDLKATQVTLAKTELELKLPVEIEQLKAQTRLANFEVDSRAPAEVANITKQGKLLEVQTGMAEFELTSKAPLELQLITVQRDSASKDLEAKVVQVDSAKFELANKLPLDIEQGKAQLEAIKYANTTRAPAEVANLVKQGELLTTQVRVATFDIEQKAPKELEMLSAQVSNATKEVELKSTQVNMAKVELETKMPVEIAYLNAQKDTLINQGSKIPYEINILKQQEAMSKAETTLSQTRNSNLVAEAAKTPVEVEILRKQSLLADSEIDMIAKQIETITMNNSKIPVEITAVKTQTDEVIARTAQVKSQTARIEKELTDKLPLELAVLTKEQARMDSEVGLNESKVRLSLLEEKKAPSSIEYVQAQIANMGKQNLILERDLDIKVEQVKLTARQVSQADAEIEIKKQELETARVNTKAGEAQAALYTQKVTTEKAQVDSSVIGVGSVIARNNKVLEQQAIGFDRDAQNRALKVMLDTFVATYANGDRSANATNLLTDAIIGNVVKKNLDDLNISTTTT